MQRSPAWPGPVHELIAHSVDCRVLREAPAQPARTVHQPAAAADAQAITTSVAEEQQQAAEVEGIAANQPQYAHVGEGQQDVVGAADPAPEEQSNEGPKEQKAATGQHAARQVEVTYHVWDLTM